MNIEQYFDTDRKVHPLFSVLFSILIIAADLLTPPQVLLSIFFVLPVVMAGWFNGLRWAMLLTFALPLARFLIAVNLEPLWDINYNIINALDRVVVLAVVGIIASRLSHSVRLLQREVKVLEGLIPICANCKKIRDEQQEWQPLEKYIIERSDAKFSHGVCPECLKTLYPDYRAKT
jgi:hypothetical protein